MSTIPLEQNFDKIVIRGFQEYRDILKRKEDSSLEIISETDFIFRGQANPYWPLASSYYRLYHKYKSAGIQCPSENQMMDAFREGFKRKFEDLKEKEIIFKIISDPNNKKKDLEALVLMQLHGACTRLLDFTHSAYVALYIAAKDMNMNPYNSGVFHFAVFAVNKKMISEDERELCFDLKKYEEIDYKDSYSLHSFKPCEEIKNTVLRCRQQESVFIYIENPLTNINHRFIIENNWNILRGNKSDLIKIEFWLDLNAYKDLMINLNNKGCSEDKLFPGEDGFCRSLNSFITS